MLRMLARTALMGAVQKGTGVTAAGPISAALLTTGASMMLTRGRRPIGLALAAAGGLLLWHETQRDRERAAADLLRKRQGDGAAAAAVPARAGADPATAPR
jgi:hypothetical protein